MVKKADTTTTDAAAPTGPVQLRYVGPPDVDSPRHGALVPGRCYQEADRPFAVYLTTTHPDHWELA